MKSYQRYWHYELKRHGITKRGGIYSIKDMASALHFHLYGEEKEYDRGEADDFLAEEMNRHKGRREGLGACVYFIGNMDHGYVKIGYSTDVCGRLGTIQTNCPLGLSILKTVDGQSARTLEGLEKKMHKRFRDYWVRGEWYRIDGELLSFIEGDE